jgi:hypothetical protein
MGARGCLTKTFLILIAVATVTGCEDNTGLTKICALPTPCAVDQNGTIIKTKVTLEKHLEYRTGECKLGILKCDEDGNEYCDGVIKPSQEICDSKDNDCNGVVDNGFDTDGDGITTCAGDCDDFNSRIHPYAVELCNNMDDNCNNLIDENVSRQCWDGDSVVMNELSTCQYGTSTCSAGLWSECSGEIGPVEEICDDLDNDCDGEIDEPVYLSCGPDNNVGVCVKGNKECSGNEQICNHAVYPTGEVCDGLDNNCDGIVDDGLFRRCSTVCGDGFETCFEGGWRECTAPQPKVELCDRIDNDCDGDTDEGCNCSQGQANICRNNILDANNQPVMCGFGITICDINGMWGPCRFHGTEAEKCNNWDDDCDGQVDGMLEACGNRQFAGIGECRMGEKECSLGHWSSCVGEVSPRAEICDHLDNDCDGEVDENLNGHEKVDMIFAIDISGSMCLSINALVQGISNYVSSFIGTNHRFGIVTFPGRILNLQNRITATLQTNPPLMDVSGFQRVLSTITCNGGGWEPSYDVTKMLLEPQDPLQISWRSDAYPYVILITDEPPQTWTSQTQATVAPLAVNCQIGGCQPGDKAEIYIITDRFLFSMWNLITYNESDRLINIYPANASRYTQFFRNIFANLCI